MEKIETGKTSEREESRIFSNTKNILKKEEHLLKDYLQIRKVVKRTNDRSRGLVKIANATETKALIPEDIEGMDPKLLLQGITDKTVTDLYMRNGLQVNVAPTVYNYTVHNAKADPVPVSSTEASVKTTFGNVEYDRETAPLLYHKVMFEVTYDQLNQSRDILNILTARAVEKLMNLKEDLILKGATGTYGAGKVEGLTTSDKIVTKTLTTAWNAVNSTAEPHEDIIDGLVAISRDDAERKKALILNKENVRAFSKDYSDEKVGTIMNRIRQIEGIDNIVVSSKVPVNCFLLFETDIRCARWINRMDIKIFIEDHDNFKTTYTLMFSGVPMVLRGNDEKAKVYYASKTG